MKKLLSAFTLALVPVCAAAADLPARTPAVAPAPAAVQANWSGCYLGGGLGYQRLRNATPLAADLYNGGANTAESAMGSARIGCDYQISSIVIGAFGGVDKFSAKGQNDFYPVGPGFPEYSTTRASWSASAGLRLGYLVTADLLAYAKGGVAWTRFHHTDYDTTPANSFYGRASSSRNGWMAGGGLEYRISANWSMFTEYTFTDFGSRRVQLVDGIVYSGAWFNNYSNKAQNVLVGVHYKFN